MHIAVRQEREIPGGLTRIIADARSEGFTFVDRLVREWESGDNRFDRPGEAFFCAYRDGSLVGVGGLSVDRYCRDSAVGRLRHLYVAPGSRALGFGAALVRAVVQSAHAAFRVIRLRTDRAAPFYEHLGFSRVVERDATHVLHLE